MDAAWAYRIFALLLLAAVVFYALRTYHHRELARIETAELELDGYVKIALAAVTFAWQCPDCGTPLLTAEGLLIHQALDSSACARTRAQAEREREMADAEAAQAARDPGGYSMSATQVPDEAVTTAELEQ